jgi:mycothiol synthase
VTPTFPPEHRLRAATPADADAVFAVVEARSEADGVLPHYSAADLPREWTVPGLDLARDSWVVEDAEGVAAAAWLVPEPPYAEVAVHPRASGRGIGSALRAAIEARAAEKGVRTLIQAVASSDESGRALLEAAGYVEAHRYTFMQVDLDGPPAEPRLPDGIAVRPFEPGRDDRAVFDVDDAAFAGSPDFIPQPFDAWRVEHVEADAVRPQASPLAWAGNELAGFALNQMRAPGLGYVEILAVADAWRGRGLGRALLLRSFADFAAIGARAVGLGVAGHNDRARGLYESVGMRPRYVVLRYEKRL